MKIRNKKLCTAYRDDRIVDGRVDQKAKPLLDRYGDKQSGNKHFGSRHFCKTQYDRQRLNNKMRSIPCDKKNMHVREQEIVLGNQTTLKTRMEFNGIGVHSGKPVTLSLNPAEANTGILFNTTCPNTGKTADIPANINSVAATDLSTVLGEISGVHIATVEHLMAALRALDVDNVIIEADGNEVPVMDGSSRVFVEGIVQAGIASLATPRCYIRVKKPVRFDMGASWGEFLPYHGSRFEIDFESDAIGRQSFASDLSAEVFTLELASARTFGFMKDVEKLWSAGFALGSSLENSVVIGDDDQIINPEGLRFADEFVRHKTLDAIGDLALAGAPIIGCYRSYRGGHKLNALTLNALLRDSEAFDFVESSTSKARVSPSDMVAVGAPAYAASLI